MSEPRRLVVVTSGFGLWSDGRHQLSARWSEVERVAAVRPAAGVTDPAAFVLRLTLADGREFALDALTPGWDAFLAVAPGMLTGMPAAAAWQPTLLHSPAAAGATVVLYERRRAAR